MMGQRTAQMELLMYHPEDLIPTGHLLKQVDRLVSFECVYDLVKGSYSEKGRPSIDPVCLIKMLLVGYLYGIKSERRLTEEISLNIAYRWFCGFGMMEKIPDHSTFTKNRKLRCGIYYTINPKKREYSEDTRKLAIKANVDRLMGYDEKRTEQEKDKSQGR